MKILVTGGTGVIGEGVIPELLQRKHQVRLLSRHANDDAKQWEGVEAFDGNVAEAASLAGACDGCDAVLHIAGIAKEEPPDRTFAKINVEGTRNILAEAARTNVRRFVYVSSMGADIGASDYHRSKREAEALVTASSLDWTIVRPGNVYGPGDEVISTMLKMIRALPVIPVIDNGDQEFQPIWYEDLAKVLAITLDHNDLQGAILEAAGAEITSMNDVIARFKTITDRNPVRIPVPAALASVTAKLASLAIDMPLDDEKLTMLNEKNVLRGENALEKLGVSPTPLEQGLRTLADAVPEQLPEEGVGGLHHKHFHADITGSRHTPATLMSHFREHVTEIMPIEFAAEPGAPTRIERGTTLTGALPLRGNFQVRVEVAEPTRVIFATIEGHPLAGIVEFTTSEEGPALRFSIDVFARASNAFDWLAARMGGDLAQSANWRSVVQRMVDASGGTSDGVHQESTTLDEAAAAHTESRVKDLIQSRQRAESRA